MNPRDPGAPRMSAYEELGRFLRGETQSAYERLAAASRETEFERPPGYPISHEAALAAVVDAVFRLILEGKDATALAKLAGDLVSAQATKINELRDARDLLRRLARCAFKSDGERVELDMDRALWEELRLVGLDDVWSAGARS